MSGVLIAILLLAGIFLAASVAFSRTTYEVQSAPDTEYLELEGHWIRYHVSGGGPPVVLVHGWLSSSRIWERLAGRLAQRFTVYTLDLSGFGDSDKPVSGYGVRYGSRLLYAFCAHFGLARAAVVGHDVGGAMAVKLAADHPDVVGRLVLVATPADEDQIDLPTLLWLATLPVVGPVFYTLGRYAPFLRRMWMRPFVSDPGDLTEEAVDDSGRSTPAAVAKTLKVMQREVSRGRLVRQARIIKVPVLLIAGEEDQIVDPDATSDWEAAFPSAESFLMDGVGHVPMLERVTEFDARILAFLTGDPRYLDMPAVEETETQEKLIEEPEDEDLFDEPEEEHPAPPRVTRKRDDHYPSRDIPPIGEDEDTIELNKQVGPREAPDEVPAEEEPPAGEEAAPDKEPPASSRRDRARREVDEDDEDDESPSPEEIFRWPEAWKEFRAREPFDPGPWDEPDDDTLAWHDDEEEPDDDTRARRDDEEPDDDTRA